MRSSVTLSLIGSIRATFPVRRVEVLLRNSNIRRLPYGQAARTPLVKARLDPETVRLNQTEDRLAGNHRRAGFRVSANHQAIPRGQQTQVAALLADTVLVSFQPKLLLASAQ